MPQCPESRTVSPANLKVRCEQGIGSNATILSGVTVGEWAVVAAGAVVTKVVVIPGSGNPDHIKENLDLFDFELTDKEMRQINALNRDEKHDWY